MITLMHTIEIYAKCNLHNNVFPQYIFSITDIGTGLVKQNHP